MRHNKSDFLWSKEPPPPPPPPWPGVFNLFIGPCDLFVANHSGTLGVHRCENKHRLIHYLGDSSVPVSRF